MLDQTVDLSNFTVELAPYMTAANTKQMQLYIRFMKRLLLKYSVLRLETQALLNDIHFLLINDNWLKLEILASQLSKNDDILFRRCLFYFAKCMEPSVIKPSVVTVFDTNINLLNWYQTNYQLGCELNVAIICWDKISPLADSTKREHVRKTLYCLNLLCQKESSILDGLLNKGLLWFESVNRFREVFKQYPIKDKYRILESALLDVLQAYKPSEFVTVMITINHRSVEVTDLAELDHCIVLQLRQLAGSPKFTGEKEHGVISMTRRFFDNVNSIRTVFDVYPEFLNDTGLDIFKANKFKLLNESRKLLTKKQFSELVLFLEDHFKHTIHRHNYIDNLLPFYFEKQKKYNLINTMI